MVGKVLFSFVVRTPGMLPADLPSHSYLNLRAFGAGCSVISTLGSESMLLLLLELSMNAGSAFCKTSTESMQQNVNNLISLPTYNKIRHYN
jgi:hypothetical protein